MVEISKNSEQNIAVFVLWQSLVVKAYRSFFTCLTRNANWRVACASPQRFRELGLQEIESEPFDKPFAEGDSKFPYFLLKSWNLHVQIVLFCGLGRALRKFFTKKKGEKRVFLCIADPYSLTAFFAWLTARIWVCGDLKFVLFASQNIFKKLPLPLKCIQNFLFKRCDAILSIGPEQDEVIRKHGYKGKIFDFPLWFDSNLFEFLTVRRNLNSGIWVTSYGQKLGYAGSLSWEKGIPDLLACLKSGAIQGEYCVAIAGSGPLKDEVKSKCTQLKSKGLHIEFLGPLSSTQMREFYQNIDILIVPSRTVPHWKEQFGRVIVEAQACGVLVIGSDSGAIPNVIGNKEFVFKEGDIQDMSRVLNSALSKIKNSTDSALRSQFAKEAFQRFSDEVLAQRLTHNLLSKL